MKDIKSIEKMFNVSSADMRKIMTGFLAEMKRGLSGKKGSLDMIPAFVDSARGDEKGKFIALDLGGTNFRILELELEGGGRSKVLKAEKLVLDKKHMNGSGAGLFDFIAQSINAFLRSADTAVGGGRLDLGFTFSFPVRQTGVASGYLVRWTKGFSAKGVEGKDVVKLLNKALARNGLHNVSVSALVNDTVGTLMAKSYEDRFCDVGVIIGTGTNACYRERLSEIKKPCVVRTESGHMIINTEWGNFNKLRLTPYDVRLDAESAMPGEQVLEKMVSGRYLGELVRLVICYILEGRYPALCEKYNFKTEYVSRIEADNSGSLKGVKAVLDEFSIPDSTLKERRLIKRICSLVSLRASRVSAAALAAVVTKMDPKLERRHTVAIDGSVYEKHPNFSKNMKKALREILGKRATKIKISLAKDGSGRGAAVIAAVA